MIQKAIEKTAEGYMLLSSSERREKLKSIKYWENLVSALSLFLLIGTRHSNFGAVRWLFSAFSIRGIKLEYLVFPLLFIFEVAIARTAKNSVPLVVLLATSVMATVITYGDLFCFVIYSLVFIYTEVKLIAMKAVPGYPLFEDAAVKVTPQQPEYEAADIDDIHNNDVYADAYDTPYDESSGRFEMKELAVPENLFTEDNNDSEKN